MIKSMLNTLLCLDARYFCAKWGSKPRIKRIVEHQPTICASNDRGKVKHGMVERPKILKCDVCPHSSGSLTARERST